MATEADADTIEAAVIARKGVSQVTFVDGQSTTFEPSEKVLALSAAARRRARNAAGDLSSRVIATSKGL